MQETKENVFIKPFLNAYETKNKTNNFPTNRVNFFFTLFRKKNKNKNVFNI